MEQAMQAWPRGQLQGIHEVSSLRHDYAAVDGFSKSSPVGRCPERTELRHSCAFWISKSPFHPCRQGPSNAASTGRVTSSHRAEYLFPTPSAAGVNGQCDGVSNQCLAHLTSP